MTGGFEDPFAGDHLDHLSGSDHFGGDHFGGDHFEGNLGGDDLGGDHLGLGEDLSGADHDTGFHDSGYEHAGHDAYDPETGHEPQPAEEPPGVAPDHVDLSADHVAAAGDGTLPHSVDTSPFPPHLEVDVTPADGQDWVDPEHLGEPEPAFLAGTDSPQALLAGLHESEGADPTGSDDPAIRALALFWSR
jgi:hypothetical protein